MADDNRINLLSATGSTEMGKALVPRVQREWVKHYTSWVAITE